MATSGMDDWAAARQPDRTARGYASPRRPDQPPRPDQLPRPDQPPRHGPRPPARRPDYPDPRPYPDPRHQPDPWSPGQVARRTAPPISVQLSTHPHRQLRDQTLVRRIRTWPQRLGGVLMAGCCVVAAAWYVPRVMSNDRHLLTGTVVSSGVVTLNFPDAGQLAGVKVHLDQAVRKGQVLASEYAPNAESLVTADKAAIAAQRAKIAQLKAAEAADPAGAAAGSAQIAAAKAQLALDQAQLATDRMKVTAAEIIAPSAGVVVAVNGQPGETVTPSGIRAYATDSQQVPSSQRPSFSLLPEGPQPVRRNPASGSALPVVALRVSSTWQVIALIPESSVSAIKAGRRVTIDVPAARITGVPGRIDEVLPTPASSSGGGVYQAMITVTGRTGDPPMNGMAADVRLD